LSRIEFGVKTEQQAIISAAKSAADRLGTLDRFLAGFILIDRTASDVEECIRKAAARRCMSDADFRKMPPDRGYITGTPEECVNRLREFAAIGVNNFVLGYTGDIDITPSEMLRDIVAPELR
jgi:alkanesulfonate monooxygenase SsuD/methylene tetrahydromethanopterin reductase-like flavin-dependent oxidoreductase (luciferase family)